MSKGEQAFVCDKNITTLWYYLANRTFSWMNRSSEMEWSDSETELYDWSEAVTNQNMEIKTVTAERNT